MGNDKKNGTAKVGSRHSELGRVCRHLLRSRRTIHAAGGVGILAVHAFEMSHVFIFGRRSKVAENLSWIVMAPFVLGLLTPHLRRRMSHNGRSFASLTGMMNMVSFLSLAHSTADYDEHATPQHGTPSRIFEPLFRISLICSLACTYVEVTSGLARGNGWIFGVVFTYLTLSFPGILDCLLADQPERLKDIYETNRFGTTVYYNCIHNSFFVSLGFFFLSIRDSKICSEEFIDKAGRLLWTFPQIPLCYAAIWRVSCLRYANLWFVFTGAIAGAIIFVQKKGWLNSTLKEMKKRV